MVVTEGVLFLMGMLRQGNGNKIQMGEAREMDELKQLAKNAKNRMKSGFWDRQKAESGESKKKGMNNYFMFIKSQTAEEQGGGDKQFYEMVKQLMEENDPVENPIGRLIDHAYYETLDYSQKQKYILELAEKYRSVAATIQNDK